MSETWTTLKVLQWTAGRFAEKGVDSARLDAEILLAHVLGTNRVGLYTSFDKPLQEAELARYRELIRRRLGGEPVAYLVGTQEFWSMAFTVDARVLVPRRDTETLVEVAIAAATARAGGGGEAPVIADVCTGSGAVALALAKELPEARVIASDVSEGALEVARGNAERLGFGARVTFRAGDLVGAVVSDGPFDLIVSNPPYVRRGEIAGLAVEVQREPRLALDGGEDGLEIVRRLVDEAAAAIKGGGTLAFEHGFDQGAAARQIMERAGFVEVVTTKDLAGRERVTHGRRP